MTDPTVSNVRVTARADHPAPAEGLPPCMKRVAIFEGRQATWHHRSICSIPEIQRKPIAHYVLYGQTLPVAAKTTPMLKTICPGTEVQIETDDPVLAQAAFDKGAEYVRTGVLE